MSSLSRSCAAPRSPESGFLISWASSLMRNLATFCWECWWISFEMRRLPLTSYISTSARGSSPSRSKRFTMTSTVCSPLFETMRTSLWLKLRPATMSSCTRLRTMLLFSMIRPSWALAAWSMLTPSICSAAGLRYLILRSRFTRMIAVDAESRIADARSPLELIECLSIPVQCTNTVNYIHHYGAERHPTDGC